MSLTHTAIWLIERNLDRPLSLSQLADSCGVSRYHLAHAFGAATGHSVMQYVRGRRLSEAARALASGAAPDILSLALEAGYSSHEAFSRAFRAQFGKTPESVRRDQTVADLALVEAIKTPRGAAVALAPPRFIAAGPMIVVGLSERYTFETAYRIPLQWGQFMARLADIPERVGGPLGVSANMDNDGNFEYICAVEVAKSIELPRRFVELRIPAQYYAVFLHAGHVSNLAASYVEIWNNWLPAHGQRGADGPCLELSLPGFDPETGNGGVELWIPVVAPPAAGAA